MPNSTALSAKEWDWQHCCSDSRLQRLELLLYLFSLWLTSSDYSRPGWFWRSPHLAVCSIPPPPLQLRESRKSYVFACGLLQFTSAATGMLRLRQDSAYFSARAVNCGGCGLGAAVGAVTSSATSNQGALRRSLAMMEISSPTASCT